MNTTQETRHIKHGQKKIAQLIRQLGITNMLIDVDSQKRAIEITVLLSHSRKLLDDYSEDQLSTILTMVMGKRFGRHILKKPMEAVRQFETASRSHKQRQEVLRLKQEAVIVVIEQDQDERGPDAVPQLNVVELFEEPLPNFRDRATCNICAESIDQGQIME